MKTRRERTLDEKLKCLTEHPEEWDFRTISRKDFYYASIYELGRLCEWVLEAFRKWHKQELNFPKAVGALKSWNGITIEKALYRMQHCEAPWEVTAFIDGGGPEGMETGDNVELVFFLSHLFPVPFLKLIDIDSIVAAAKTFMPLRGRKSPAFARLTHNGAFLSWWPYGEGRWNEPEYVRRMNSQGVNKYQVVIDRRHSKERIKREACKWIDSLDAKGVKKFPVKKGKAAAIPWHELKELSAYRMSKLGLSWSQAQKFIKDYISKHPLKHDTDVLPIYSSSGWSTALSNVEARIAKLFPRPGPPNPGEADHES
jgi:hypothetical protein